jgi:hypothetical protein
MYYGSTLLLYHLVFLFSFWAGQGKQGQAEWTERTYKSKLHGCLILILIVIDKKLIIIIIIIFYQ